MVFQEQSLFPNLTVGENLYLGAEAQFIRFGLMDWSALYGAARRQLDKVSLAIDPRSAPTSSISHPGRWSNWPRP